MKQLERELIIRAAKGDGSALVHVQEHLQEMTIAWGANHARIEAQQFVIYSIAVCNREQQEAFKTLLYEMIEQAPGEAKKNKQNVTKEDYDQACERLEQIINLVNDDTPESDPTLQELIRVSDTIYAYEEEHYPIGPPTLRYRGYKGTVRWSLDAKGYYGQALDTGDDLICYEGDTLEDLEKDFQNAMDFYLETKDELNKTDSLT